MLEISFNFPINIEDCGNNNIKYINQNYKLSDYVGKYSLQRFKMAVSNFYVKLCCHQEATNFDQDKYIMCFNNEEYSVGLENIAIDLGIIFNEIKR